MARGRLAWRRARAALENTDDPLVPTVTAVKAVHFTELRAAVNAVRSAALR